jgi:hypothetical protein
MHGELTCDGCVWTNVDETGSDIVYASVAFDTKNANSVQLHAQVR